jgi:DNA-binding NarL/FixJ family response regulator
VPPRLLIVADAKMLPALSTGLREGGRFDVQGVPLADPAAAQAAAATADAVVVFYGAPGAPLPLTLQALAPKVRERGARLVAVLQREQAAHRDECFRAGASDLLFMPMPKEQFVARLADSIGLSFVAEAGAGAAVEVATRSSSSRLDRAAVSAHGVHAPSQLPLKPGETVRLSFGSFQGWGLVAKAGPPAQIRFAGLAPDEEKRLQDWVKAGGKQQPASPPAPPAARVSPPARPTPPAPPPGARPGAAIAPPVVARPPPAVAQPAARPPPSAPVAGPPPGVRSAPVAGPPPGYADRKSPNLAARSTSTPARGVERHAGGSAAPGAVQAPSARPPPAPGNGEDGPLAGLFEKPDAAAPAAAPEPPPVPKGPPWPAPVPIAVCKDAAMKVMAEEDLGPGIPANVAASAKKIGALLSVGERASIQKTGADSCFADAIAARIALDAATAEGNRLGNARAAPSVDVEALGVLTKFADEAAARLQKEANAAIGKGEVEILQLVTAASASLSRDLLNLKETADRLRGLGAAPRMGAGALDPDMILPGQQPRPRPAAVPQAAPVVKPELRDFRGLDQTPGRGKSVFAAIVVVGAIAVAAHAFYFGVPHHTEVAGETAGRGVQRIDVNGNAALVTVTQDWVASADANLPKLVQVLRAQKVAKAVLFLPGGKATGVVDVVSGKASGIPRPPPTAPQP